jgi:hypothetical protein
MMDRNEPYRPISDNPPKRLEDVAYMLKMLGMTTASLRNRVFFLDDIPDHQIRWEIPGHHYIQITPRFYNNTEEDKTNYRPLLAAMNERMPRTQRLAAKIGGGESRKSTKRAHANRRGSRRNAGSQRAGSRSKKYRKKNLMNILSDI